MSTQVVALERVLEFLEPEEWVECQVLVLALALELVCQEWVVLAVHDQDQFK